MTLPTVSPYRTISYTQASQNCGYQLRYYREHAPTGPTDARRLVGRAVHAGVEYHLAFGDVTEVTQPDGSVLQVDPSQQAVERAHQELDVEIERAERESGLRWDETHRLTRAGEVYKSDRGLMPSYEYALRVVGLEVMAWIARFGGLRSQSIERKVRVDIGQGWRFTGYLDVEIEGGVIDVKTAKEPWDVEGRQFDKLEQAQLYQYGKLLEDGAPPDFFAYHVIPHTGLGLQVQESEDGPPDVVPVDYDPAAIQIIAVEYDEAAVTRVIEHRLAPVIRTIEADAYVPVTDGWWCSSAYCDYWGICPLGAAARRKGGEGT